MGDRRLSFAAVVGCLGLMAGGCALPVQPDGTLRVSHSCSRADTITVTIDGVVAGTVARSSHADFPLDPGSHTVSARSRNGYEWDPRSSTIESGRVTTLSLLCVF
jgi:hypothetical protein